MSNLANCYFFSKTDLREMNIKSILDSVERDSLLLRRIMNASIVKFNSTAKSELNKIIPSSLEHEVLQLGHCSDIIKGIEATLDNNDLIVKWL